MQIFKYIDQNWCKRRHVIRQ